MDGPPGDGLESIGQVDGTIAVWVGEVPSAKLGSCVITGPGQFGARLYDSFLETLGSNLYLPEGIDQPCFDERLLCGGPLSTKRLVMRGRELH